jgi:uncharacterized protein with PIN domain
MNKDDDTCDDCKGKMIARWNTTYAPIVVRIADCFESRYVCPSCRDVYILLRMLDW